MFRPFSWVLRTQGAPVPLLATFVGSLPIGMLTLGILLLVRQTTESYAVAGTAAGAFSFGNALGLLIQGRLIDRHGPARVLLTAATLCPTLLVTLTVTITQHAAAPLLITLAAASGATLPATVTGMRVLCPRLLPDPGDRTAAYALLATLFQVAMVTGPLLVAALALTGTATPVLPTAAALTAAGGLLFATAPAVRAWSPPSTTRPAGRIRSAIRTPVVTLVLGTFGVGAATGMLTVAVAAARPALAGLLFAAFAAGELLGGLVYGGVRWTLPNPVRLIVGQCGMSAAVALLALSSGTGWPMPASMLLIGALTAPAAIAGSALLDDVVPPGSLGRAYTMLVAAGLIGVAAGNATAGRLAGDTRTTLLLTAVTLSAVAAWTLARRRTLVSQTT
ncbi:MFS transporter [Paractinoplanes rishiriensis]|uniref:MFS transporter n=1 Tax=Paractinoplanes rishiriensis TaxID=1050105 RepID=A0A919N060_9ACTN|nr:MFS transporter [Actinoplanes rishiriensis]